MKFIVQIASAGVMALVLVTGQAQAAGLCNLTGHYSDDYGSTTSITGKKGTILNTAVCQTAYTFRISKETTKGFDVMGKNPTKSCGTFTAQLTFQGKCSVFSGSVTLDGSTLSDTFTKIKSKTRSEPDMSSDLSDGLR